jgi:hypothetical protein
MQPRETKLADTVASCVEDHFFNTAAVARHLSNQPIYTVDKVMELVVNIVFSMKQRYDVELAEGNTSEGLILANNLHKAINIVKEKREFNNIKIPSPKQYKTKSIENLYQESNRKWLHEDYHGEPAQFQAIATVGL